MIYHVLPGDSQVEEFRKTALDGELVVFREALITGPIDAVDVNDFWDRRARFILAEYGEDVIDYHEKVADEIIQLADIGDGDEVNLWFEYELFCSVNMWFCLDQLTGSSAEIYRVAPINPTPDDVWKGFGEHNADDLMTCFESRTAFTDRDLETGSLLWKAYKDRDTERLKSLGDYRSPCFPFLKEVCDAAAEIETRPVQLVAQLKASGFDTPEKAFHEFQKRAGVYGFGDMQVERILNSL